MRSPTLLVALALASSLAAAAPEAGAIDRCRGIADPAERLRCYDELGTSGGAPSRLGDRWELDPEGKHGVLQFRFHRPNYILPAVVSDDVNVTPQTSTRPYPDADPLSLKRVEAKFQLSFKTKLWQNVFGDRADLWFGYSQQSYWQIYSASISRPFRETNYEPELILAVRTEYQVAGLRGRLLAFGLVHESNGRSEPFSRSWNRVYALIGLERGNFVLTLKPWYRLRESGDEDDNPDISSYLGRGEVHAFWQVTPRQTLSLRVRPTFDISPSWGSAQFDWRFPLARHAGGYLQAFTGHGESMIDHNFRKTSLGLGVVIGNWY